MKKHTSYHFPKFAINSLVDFTIYCQNVENLSINYMDLSVKNTVKMQ